VPPFILGFPLPKCLTSRIEARASRIRLHHASRFPLGFGHAIRSSAAKYCPLFGFLLALIAFIGMGKIRPCLGSGLMSANDRHRLQITQIE